VIILIDLVKEMPTNLEFERRHWKFLEGNLNKRGPVTELANI
jgi:hypothetical protein